MSYAVIESQVRFFQSQADEESWLKEHKDAMACFNIEALIRSGRSVFDTILSAGPHASTPEEVIDLYHVLGAWRLAYRKLLENGIERYRRMGYAIAGVDQIAGADQRAASILAGAEDFPAHLKYGVDYTAELLSRLSADAGRPRITDDPADDDL